MVLVVVVVVQYNSVPNSLRSTTTLYKSRQTIEMLVKKRPGFITITQDCHDNDVKRL